MDASRKAVIILLSTTLVGAAFGFIFYLHSGQTLSVMFQTVGQPAADSPTGVPPDAIIHQTELTAQQYSIVLESLEQSVTIRNHPILMEQLQSAEYIQIDGHFYRIETTVDKMPAFSSPSLPAFVGGISGLFTGFLLLALFTENK